MPDLILAVSARDVGDRTVITARGVIDYGSRSVLREATDEALDGGKVRLVLDLSGVTLCDSSGLSTLVDVHRRATAAGGWLRLAGLRPIVSTALTLTNLDRVLPVYDTAEKAVEAA
ncbi:STAS domain-containing protein [Dactylosporangium roseum]|uniref:Anti-sigma factor antagonist n=1 Tax=Dactylosporangium roseum TaxID=47989 RepID=A0ABY5Z5L3_9ACTN|nr:STAS domain-containing protein [Dactylosporangium roseum]UWZ36343.1 STAS domain-containing protein [Dactylosporangium roseum]